MIDKYEFADSLGGVREFFVDEAMKGSDEMKNVVVTKITVAAACVTLAVAAGLMAFFLGRGGGNITPADTVGGTEPQTSDTSPVSETEPEETEPETRPLPGLTVDDALERAHSAIESEWPDCRDAAFSIETFVKDGYLCYSIRIGDDDGSTPVYDVTIEKDSTFVQLVSPGPDYEPPQETEPPETVQTPFEPSPVEGDITGYIIDSDVTGHSAAAEFALECAKEDGKDTDGLAAYAHFLPEACVGRKAIAFCSLYYPGDRSKEDNTVYVVRCDLETEECELLEKFQHIYETDIWYETARKYGVPTIPCAGIGIEYYDYYVSDRYWLFKPEGTHSLELLDRETGKSVLLVDWYESGVPGAVAAYMWDEKAVVYTVRDPQYTMEPERGAKITRYVYYIGTGETELFDVPDGYSIWDIKGNTLILESVLTDEQRENGDYSHKYFSVDLSEGINSTMRPEPFLDEAEYDFCAYLSNDGRYLIYFNDHEYTESPHRVTVRSYDRLTGETKTASIENEWFIYAQGYMPYKGNTFIIDCGFSNSTAYDGDNVSAMFVFDFGE